MYSVLSGYVPVIQFRSDAEKIVDESIILPKVQAFFNARGVPLGRRIDASQCIAPKDFKGAKQINFKYFYDVLLDHLAECEDPSKSVAYSITFDESLILSEDKHEICPHTNIPYLTVDLGGRPVFYYLLFDLQKVLDYLRSQTLHKPIWHSW